MLNNLIYPGVLLILSAVLGWIGTIVLDTRKINKANAQGTMLLLRRQIVRDHYKFVTRGEPMRAFDYKDLTEIHETYKALGGNGLTDKMFDELATLDIVGD